MELHNIILFVALLTKSLNFHLASAEEVSQVSDAPSRARQGRLLDLKAARKLGMFQFLGGLLANSAGKGSFAASNTYNLFGKTVNSALSLSYGSTGSVPSLPGLPAGGPLPVAAGAPLPAVAGAPAITVRREQGDAIVIKTSNDLPPATPEPQQQQDMRKPMASNNGIRDQKFSGGVLPEEEGQSNKPISRQNIVVDLDGAQKLLESEQFNRFISQHNANVEVFNNRRNVVG